MFKTGFSKTDLSPALVPDMPIREPIEALCVYIEMKEQRCLLAVLDFMDFDKLYTDSLRDAISDSVGLDLSEIHILTTHNHGGGEPDIAELSRLVGDGAYRAAECAEEAEMRYATVSLEKQLSIMRRLYIPELSGVCTIYFGASEENGFDTGAFVENALRLTEEGKICNSKAESDAVSGDVFSRGDDMLFAIEFRTPQGKTLGSIVRYAAHAVCANRQGSYSSDYPYYVRSAMERICGGVSVFLNGPCAEIAPAMRDKYEGRERTLGEYLAVRACEALAKAEFNAVGLMRSVKYEIKLPVRREVLENSAQMPEWKCDGGLPEKREYAERAKLVSLLPFLRKKYMSGECGVSESISVFIGLLRIDDVVIAAYPGETFNSTASAVSAVFPDIKICSVTEHERTAMYIPPDSERALGGYESVCSVTAAGAEEILRRACIEQLRNFLK